jgi:hypothetical protein
MRDIQGAAGYADVVEAPSPFGPATAVRFGIRSDTFGRYVNRGLATAIAQYYGLVQQEIMQAKHVFRGLKRPLALDENMNADRNVLIYAWLPLNDYQWVGSRFEGRPECRAVQAGRVFVVLVREEPEEHGVSGSIEKWNWVREDPILTCAPVGWEQRYEQKLWSR